jgi:hypothetical protein
MLGGWLQLDRLWGDPNSPGHRIDHGGIIGSLVLPYLVAPPLSTNHHLAFVLNHVFF